MKRPVLVSVETLFFLSILFSSAGLLWWIARAVGVHSTTNILRESNGKVRVLAPQGAADAAYAAVNTAILDEAATIGHELRQNVLAVVVWNGISKGDSDHTDAFAEEARRRGLPIVEISTTDIVSSQADR